MPLTRLSVPDHLSAQQVRGLADAVHDALVECCGVPQGDRFQLISRFERDHLILDPTYGDVQRTADACVIEITFLSGRTDAQKRQLYRDLAARSVGIGLAQDDLVVGLVENGAIDWSLGNGRAYIDK
jgi:phenylpyruvate tautomerase PptA (4-oxalocrotonate tautomerase family)